MWLTAVHRCLGIIYFTQFTTTSPTKHMGSGTCEVIHVLYHGARRLPFSRKPLYLPTAEWSDRDNVILVCIHIAGPLRSHTSSLDDLSVGSRNSFYRHMPCMLYDRANQCIGPTISPSASIQNSETVESMATGP